MEDRRKEIAFKGYTNFKKRDGGWVKVDNKDREKVDYYAKKTSDPSYKSGNGSVESF